MYLEKLGITVVKFRYTQSFREILGVSFSENFHLCPKRRYHDHFNFCPTVHYRRFKAPIAEVFSLVYGGCFVDSCILIENYNGFLIDSIHCLSPARGQFFHLRFVKFAYMLKFRL